MHSKSSMLEHFWSILGTQFLFSKNLALSYVAPHEPLTPCCAPEKTKEPISRNLPDRRMARPYSQDPSGHRKGSNKSISQLRGIAVDNKNKIQYNSAYNTSLTQKFSKVLKLPASNPSWLYSRSSEAALILPDT